MTASTVADLCCTVEHPALSTMSSFFEPTAAVAACKAEDIMNMSADRLAQIAWPLLTDAERTLSMRDVLFSPPLRVSASPRATESAFAAGIQSCLTELAEGLAEVPYGETPPSIARLRAQALAYHIDAAAASLHKTGPGGVLPSSLVTAESSPLQLDRGLTTHTALAAGMMEGEGSLFDFALPSFSFAEDGQRDEQMRGAEVDPCAAGAAPGAPTAIHSAAHNHPPSDAPSVAPAVPTSNATATGSESVARPAKAAVAAAAAKGTDGASKQPHGDAQRASYERKTRPLVSKFVEEQWESVVASALLSDPKVNVTTPAAGEASAAAQQLRRRMLRTALVLCHLAPSSAEAGYSFVCLLKHALRAVAAATDAIRSTDGAIDVKKGDAAAPGKTTERSVHETLSSSSSPAKQDLVASSSTSAEAETDATSLPPAREATADAASQQSSFVAQQALLWVEVVLPLLHCVSLVRWTDDVLIELGQTLETVAAAAPSKLVAAAQQQQQQQRKQPSTTAGRHSASLRATKSCARKSAAGAVVAEGVSTSGGGGSGVEQTVDFTVRVPFQVEIHRPGMTHEEVLRTFNRDTAATQNNDDNGNNSLDEDANSHNNNNSNGNGGQLPHQQQPPPPPQPSLTNGSATSATLNNGSSYASSAFHEVPDIRDAEEGEEEAEEEEEEEETTEEMSVVDEEEEEDDDFTTTSAESENEEEEEEEFATSEETERASALNVSVGSRDAVEDDVDAATRFLSILLTGPRGDFESLPYRRRRTRLIEFAFPAATRVSVRLLKSAGGANAELHGRDVLLLPLESASASAEKTEQVSVEQPGAATTAADMSGGEAVVEAKRPARDALPLSLQSSRADRTGALTHNGPCRVAIPATPLSTGCFAPGEISAHLQLTLDVRWSTEWTIALATAQRTVAERLLTWVETRTQASSTTDTQQRRTRIASCVLLRGGLKGTAAAKTAEVKTYAAAAASAAATSTTAVTGLDSFIVSLLEMPLAALRARVRCHTVHADGVRATLMVIAHALLQDRSGYLHGDPLTWHTAAWSDAVRRVSLASNTVGAAAVSGEAAMEVAHFFVRHIASGCTAATTTRAQIIDAAIDLMSTPGLSLADVKAALEERRQIATAMWVVVDLLTKCSAVSRAPKHVALVSQAARRVLLLGCSAAPPTAGAAAGTAAASPHAHATSRHSAAPTPAATSSTALPTTAASAAQASHYLATVNGCGRAMEVNVRRGVHGLLTQLFRLLKALLHRIQSTQAAPHRFLLDPWEYGAFAVFTVSLMSAPMDAADVQLCAPFFADIVTGLLPSFTRLSRTESLLLTSETAEHKFLVEVAKHVRGRGSSSGEGGNAELGEADTPASREPHVLHRVEETSSSAATVRAAGEGVGLWDVLLGATAASWTPGHVRVEIWSLGSGTFYVGLASADLPADVCGPERDPGGIYFMSDGTLQYSDVARRQRRLPRWRSGDLVELSFIFASGNWDVVMALNGVSLVRLTLPRRDFRLVAVYARSGAYVPGHSHAHVLSVLPVSASSHGVAEKRRKLALTARPIAPSEPVSAPLGAVTSSTNSGSAAIHTTAEFAPYAADVRLSPFSRLTVFNVSLFLELVLHYLVLHSSRQHHPSLLSTVPAGSNNGNAAAATAATAPSSALSAAAHTTHAGIRGSLRRSASSAGLAGGSHTTSDAAVTPLAASAVESVNLVQACTAPLQHSIQQLVHLLHELSHSESSSNSNSSSTVTVPAGADGETEAYEVKRTAGQHISNAMLLDLVVTLSISLPSSTSSLAMTVDVLTAVVECEAVARKTRTVALSALYNAITQHMFSEANSPVHASAMRRLWTACYRLASEKPGYQPRFSTTSVPTASVTVFAGGRRIEHRRATMGSAAMSGNVRSVSYACNPIVLDDPAAPEVVRVSVRIQRGFQCETLGRYYFFGLADVSDTPAPTPSASATESAAGGSATAATAAAAMAVTSGELTRHPGDRAKQRRTYYISDYLSEVPEAAVQKSDTARAKNYLNTETHIIFGSGDVVTIVLYVRERCVGFERNGLPLNILYRNIPATVSHLYPFVELYNRDSRAKWMYAPDEAQMSARYTMRAMLLSWPHAVLSLVKEHLPQCCAAGNSTTDASNSHRDVDSAQTRASSSTSNPRGMGADEQDVVLGVLGADGDEMRMVYVAPPQLDQPGGRAQSVRLERFERGMAVVSDEAGSLQRVCAAALEPDNTQEVQVMPVTALRTAVQACVPELAAFATQCLKELLARANTNADGSLTSAPPAVSATSGEAPAMRHASLPHPATLLRVLRLIFSVHSSGSHSSPFTAPGAADRSAHISPQSSALSVGAAATTLAVAEPTERAMLALLPLLDVLLPAAQLDLPAPVLLREAWNELWCNPHLRRQIDITLPAVLPSVSSSPTTAEGPLEKSASSSSTAPEREVDHPFTEPAGTSYKSSAQRFDDRLRGYRVDGDKLLCPSCGKRWSACTAHHTVPSSWCDLLDRVLRLLQRPSGTASSKAAASPYCGWFAEWTDGPLDASLANVADTPSPNASQPGSGNGRTAEGAEDAPSSPPVADEDRDYHSPTSAQPSDAELWEDADDTSEEVVDDDDEEDEQNAHDGSQAAATSSGAERADHDDDDDDGDDDAETVSDEHADATSEESREAPQLGGVDAALDRRMVEEVLRAAFAPTSRSEEVRDRPSSPKDDDTPMTLTVRRASRPTADDDGDSDVVYVEGSGETRQGSFTFTGSLLSPTVLRGQMMFDSLNLPDGDGEASANQEWACPLCTFLNEPAAVRCAICANARPGASWVCPVCSYAYNAVSSSTCVTCGCMRPSSVRRLHEAVGPSAECTKCHQREHFRNFHALRYRHYCTSCKETTRWLPKDRFSTTIEARLVGDGSTLEFQWALDGYNTICFGLRTRAYNADELWGLVDAAARKKGSTAVKELGRYVAPIPERPLSTPPATPAPTRAPAAAPAAQPCMVGAVVYYASALVLRYARLLPAEQLAQASFLRRLHVCGSDWLDSWSQFPASSILPIFSQCLKLLQEGVRKPELVSTIAAVALALIRQQPRLLGAEKHALLYALCLNVVRYGDNAQRKVSYGCISALMEDDPAAALNVQPLVPVLSMEPLLEGQQRATVLALLHHATMASTPAIAKACACMARTVEAMEHQRPLPPMLGRPFPYLVALTETRLNEGGELLVGQVRGSVGVAPTKGGKYYYEVEVPHEFVSDRSKTIVMGWGTVEHERIASAQHVGSDLHSWGFNCRDHLRLMMTEQALPVPRRPSQGDVIGSMMNLETMMVCWTINGQEISWVSVPAQGDGEEIFPYVSASVEPQSVKIRLGNTRFKPAGYQDYTPPADRDLWSPDDENAKAGSLPSKRKGGSKAPSYPPQSYEFYQQLSRALEEASITTLDDASILPLLDTTSARSVLRQYPRVLDVLQGSQTQQPHASGSLLLRGTQVPAQGGGSTGDVQLLVPYIQRLRRAQELTIVVARHLSLIEKSPYLMSCYKKAADLLFSSGRWTIFELQPGGRPKYSGGAALRVLVSVRKARHVRKEADAEWLAQHPGLSSPPQQQMQPQPQPQQQRSASSPSASSVGVSGPPFLDDDASASQSSPPRRARHDSSSSSPLSAARRALESAEADSAEGTAEVEPDENAAVVVAEEVRDDGEEDEDEDVEEEEELVDVDSNDEDGDADDVLSRNLGDTSLTELRRSLQEIYGDSSHLSSEARRLRCSVTGQLFTQLEKKRVYQRARMFAVQLEGTLAVDAGGVTRAVMSMLGEELSYRFVRGVRVDPLLPLFQLCTHSTIFTVVPNMSALYASEAADDGAEGSVLRRMFEWLGKMIGNMVLCGTLKVPFDFPRLLWKTLTFQEDAITLADYAYDIDDNIIAALEDDDFVLSDDFFAALPEHVRASPAFLKGLHGTASDAPFGEGTGAAGHHAGMPSSRPLRPYVCMTPAMSMQDMSHLALEELEELAADAEAAEVGRRRALAQEALLHQYDPAFFAIRAGLTSVVPAASLRAVRWEDLRARVCGNGAASTEHVLAELDMSPLTPSMRAMLTQVLSSFTESQLSRFLLFCSGQSRIPLPEKVLVNCGDEAGRLPTAHTCSPISLLLQPCSTVAELQNSLEACLSHAAEFGFV